MIPARAGFTLPLRARQCAWPGSSPLARGLHPPSPGRAPHHRIIPARAGFTVVASATPVLREDHPRSRGVYATGSGWSGAAAGSSPLARGLRQRHGRIPPAGRIIPARAGFTPYLSLGLDIGGDHPRSRGVYSFPPASTAWSTDHPRSRGVYTSSGSRAASCPGSSPLARGLPDRDGQGRQHSRIIPARAGFTEHPRTARFLGWDHPRSRGVYTPNVGASTIIPGSSPLARGLRLLDPVNRRRCRIIPARAGFTTHFSWAPTTLRDHPRSRGVYGQRGGDVLSPAGSSPLARGLHELVRLVLCHVRIIPARAGFTEDGSRRGSRWRDHPRSRGVYSATFLSRKRMWGSSPLARGLPRPTRRGAGVAGIIPARAGFTRSARWGAWRAPDHPRSRGVYSTTVSNFRVPDGSSPLARGLRPDAPEAGDEPGIIPARAGFTYGRHCGRPRSGDHPRSRGVYSPGWSKPPESNGSSPLARGLHGRRRAAVRHRGIIPARAGFTSQNVEVAYFTWDHPRSRGVYESIQTTDTGPTGSSPLARGLHGGRGVPVRGARIIPARAGFTGLRRAPPHQVPDHPRSRGVYPIRLISDSMNSGSSPLARGLPIPLTVECGRGGIIPARAGFTGSSGRRSPSCRDHPRSRGVYMRWTAAGPPTAWIIPARAGFTLRPST